MSATTPAPPSAEPAAATEPRLQRAACFEALGTYVHLATNGSRQLDDAEAVAREVLAAVDQSCSRFRADSDLSLANASPGQRVHVDPLLAAAVHVAVEVAEDTDGLVDPLLGRSLVALGYDRDFATLAPRARQPGVPRPGAWRDLAAGLDWVEVPAGTALDLGSTGKAWASDLVARSVNAELGVDVLISLGGDISVVGWERWPVEVREHPDDAEAAEQVWIGAGGLATSSTVVRRWNQGGVRRHHVLDPRTALPAEEVWRTVTATGPSCVAANAAATAAIVLGAQAPDWLEARRVDARLVAVDGTVVRTGAWPEPEDVAR